jgi:hypothetical protein
VVGRLTAAVAPVAVSEPEISPEEQMHEVMENFRSDVEDEF